jgi:hypothetical protein
LPSLSSPWQLSNPLLHYLLQSFGSPGVFVAEWAILATWLGTLFIV